jgi:NodT family efflux transporter outer membrane factor (OMF) lipoprotein
MENLYAEKGFLYPTITGSFTPTRQKSSESLAPIVNSNAFYYCLYTAQVSVTYTADVFGGIRRQIESLKAQADSQSFTLQATYLTLTANVVNAAIQEAGLRGQIATTKKIIALQSQLLSTYKQLLDLGQVSVADVTLIEASLASAEANLAPLEKQLAIQRDLLHTLVGRFPSDTLTAKFELDSLQLPTELPLALPSSLVEHRPDVRAAEELLHAASAAIGVAIANRLPNITLSPDYGWASTSFRELLDPKNVFWDLAGSLMEPIFDGGTLKHKELAAWASYDQAAAQYRATVLNAFQNVADSLEAIQADAKAYQAAKKAESAASKTLEISRGQLEAGDTSILLLLTIEQAYHQAALNVVQAQTNRLSDTAALFQSLGGTWWN